MNKYLLVSLKVLSVLAIILLSLATIQNIINTLLTIDITQEPLFFSGFVIGEAFFIWVIYKLIKFVGKKT